MKELREQICTEACLVGKIVKSQMRWVGHMLIINDKGVPKRVGTKKQRSRRK